MKEIHETDNRNTQHPLTEPVVNPTNSYPYAGDRALSPTGTLESFLSVMGTKESIGAPAETPASQSSKYHINTTGLDYTLAAGSNGLSAHSTVNNKHDVLVSEPSLSLEYGGSAYIADTSTGATEWRIDMSDPDGSVEINQHVLHVPGDNDRDNLNAAFHNHHNSESVPHDANQYPNAYKSPSPYYEYPAVNGFGKPN